MTGEPAKNFHGVGIGPLSKIWAVKYVLHSHGIISSNVLKILKKIILKRIQEFGLYQFICRYI